MLATAPAQNPMVQNNMASLQARGHINGSSTFSASTDQRGLFPAPVPSTFSQPPPDEFPKMGSNIMNIKAGANSSLYQICTGLRQRLGDVPGFEEHIIEMEEEEEDSADEPKDPVTLMWNCLRRGYPLMTVYNASLPDRPLKFDPTKIREDKVGKATTFKFLQACMTELKIPPPECFLITDLFGEDTTGFVKVTKLVNRVLDILDRKGLLRHNEQPRMTPVADSAPTSYKAHVIEELLRTERDYIQHLEILQEFKRQVTGAIAGDAIHDIFLNLNQLLDFQRRFLVRIEQQNRLSESEQNWGKLFSYYRESFRVYEPFIANQNRCNETVLSVWPKLKKADLSNELKGIVETPSVLLSFLIKPFQRLSKYPLLLADLRHKGGYDLEKRQDLEEGEAAAKSIMTRADEAVQKEHHDTAVNELQSRVEDWKGHRINHFGELLHFGNYTVLKGEGAKVVEREYKVYLFERILLCCKEIDPNKPKNKMLATKKPLVDKKGKPKLQLKGRIFMQNVTDVVTLNQGQYTLQIFWKGDPGVENFVIRFPDETQMIRWRDTVQAQKESLCEQARNSGQTGTSATEFNYMRDQVLAQNPYQEDEDTEEEVANQIVGPTQSSFTVSRNPSSNSLRSIAGPGRMAPPTFPLAEHGNGMYVPPLSLNTNIPPGIAASPGELPGNSYFSPTNDSPISTRSTSQQSFSQFTRQQTAAGHWPHEDNKHRTAPAMGRVPSREGPPPPNSYVVNGRTVTRPSLPVMAASQNPQQQLVQSSRLRSASTPDIHNPNTPGARRPGTSHLPTQAENVPMPPIPSHMVQGRVPLNRSQTSSPVDGQLPIRSATQSPSVHRDRAHRQYQETNIYDRQGQRLQQSFDSETRDYHHGHYAEEPTQLTPQSTETSSSANSIMDYPNQLKVRVKFDPEPSHVTIVVPTFIKHRSLTDRIDSKMAKVTAASIAKKTARLRYEDSDGDMVRIETDEDVHLAIEDWATQNERQILEGPAPDFELHWQQN